MDTFENRIAVVTGGGNGMGRELVVQLAQAGCHVAFCDLDDDMMQGTLDACQDAVDKGVRVTAHRCDVSSEDDLVRFRTEVETRHDTDHINLLFNNAGVSGGQSFVRDDREQWERVFNICWGGVYLGCRVFMPLLMASDEGHIINTSSVNGFWACLSSDYEHTAYSSAKFAVKGFSESLVTDFKINAPHLDVSVVMPGHIGTNIAIASQQLSYGTPEEMSSENLDRARQRWAKLDPAAAELDDDSVRQMMRAGGESFRDDAPTTAAQASAVILEGVRAGTWRILVGEDAIALDAEVRAKPEEAYNQDFMQLIQGTDTKI